MLTEDSCVGTTTSIRDLNANVSSRAKHLARTGNAKNDREQKLPVIFVPTANNFASKNMDGKNNGDGKTPTPPNGPPSPQNGPNGGGNGDGKIPTPPNGPPSPQNGPNGGGKDDGNTKGKGDGKDNRKISAPTAQPSPSPTAVPSYIPTTAPTEKPAGRGSGGGGLNPFLPTGYPTSAPSHAPSARRGYLKARKLQEIPERATLEVDHISYAHDINDSARVALWPILIMVIGVVFLLQETALKKSKVKKVTSSAPETMDAVTAIML